MKCTSFIWRISNFSRISEGIIKANDFKSYFHVTQNLNKLVFDSRMCKFEGLIKSITCLDSQKIKLLDMVFGNLWKLTSKKVK